MTVLAARAYGLDVIDGVYNDFKDEDGFRAECEQGRTLGMDGKTLIHPSQIEPCNQVFSPSPEEIDWARRSSPPSRCRKTPARASSPSTAAWSSGCISRMAGAPSRSRRRSDFRG